MDERAVLLDRVGGGFDRAEAALAAPARYRPRSLIGRTRVVLEQRAVLLQSVLEVDGLIRRAEAAPGDEVRARRPPEHVPSTYMDESELNAPMVS